MVDFRNVLKPNPVLLGDVDGGGTAAALVVVLVVDADFAVADVASEDAAAGTLPNRARVCWNAAPNPLNGFDISSLGFILLPVVVVAVLVLVTAPSLRLLLLLAMVDDAVAAATAAATPTASVVCWKNLPSLFVAVAVEACSCGIVSFV